MKPMKTVLVLVCLITYLALPSWGIEDNSGRVGGKNKVVECVRNCINKILARINKFTAAPAQPLAQPGSYSLTPPRDVSKEESLRSLLRETQKTEDNK